MNNTRPWIIGIATGLIIMILLVYGRSTRDAYWYARGAIVRPAQVSQGEIRVPQHPINRAAGAAGPIIIYYWKR